MNSWITMFKEKRNAIELVRHDVQKERKLINSRYTMFK